MYSSVTRRCRAGGPVDVHMIKRLAGSGRNGSGGQQAILELRLAELSLLTCWNGLPEGFGRRCKAACVLCLQALSQLLLMGTATELTLLQFMSCSGGLPITAVVPSQKLWQAQ